ncbi:MULTISPECIES: cytochrome b [Pantoea]|mgnify:CR=1 FL=1|uniref:Cytochrome b561 2 YceJ n=1 Tax=Pantoea ananatis (strain AJ13355) TaxID=932677 RepID=A0A0H3KYX6_PANAA|nr:MULTISPECIES: cytochrome b [Pantoea]ASN15716.1 cytochrome b [Pantoea ananatis]AVG76517.1 cytochrome b [Pantoea ananatis]ERM11580.1 cytochrome B561 [Pantoea ananatis BRT175]MCS3405476.1 cytochrome b [Pantoea sp. B566]MCS4493635.1 cytochrome b [Pantoea sp. B623]
MLLRNSPGRYGWLSIFLHWSMALVIYAMFALGLWMVGLSYYDTWYHNAPEIHKSIGVILMLALIIRLIWRVVSPPPKPLSSYSPLVRITAVVAHGLLYGLLIAILFSGYLISTADGKPVSVFGWFSLPAVLTGAGEQADLAGDIHLWLAWSIVILSVLHGLAALKHHFIDRDITLKRMLGLGIRSPSEKEK